MGPGAVPSADSSNGEAESVGQWGTATEVAPTGAEAASGAVLADRGRVRRSLWGRDQGRSSARSVRSRGDVGCGSWHADLRRVAASRCVD